jgi:hypothetical protein
MHLPWGTECYHKFLTNTNVAAEIRNGYLRKQNLFRLSQLACPSCWYKIYTKNTICGGRKYSLNWDQIRKLINLVWFGQWSLNAPTAVRVNYGHVSRGTWNEVILCWRGPQQKFSVQAERCSSEITVSNPAEDIFQLPYISLKNSVFWNLIFCSPLKINGSPWHYATSSFEEEE